MHTAEKNLEVVQGLIDQANATTGKEDTTLTSAVGSLVDGYGGSGGWCSYDDFWDGFQENGSRGDYTRAFRCWKDEAFKPKYDIKPTSCDSIFSYLKVGDLAQKLEDCGVVLDTSNCRNLSATFQGCECTRIPHINSSKSRLYYTFIGATKVETIDKITTVASNDYVSSFDNCKALKNITFEGEIGKNIAFAQSPLLSEESVQSIIDCLVDLTGQTVQTIQFHATVKAKLTETQLTTITNKNWTLA